MIVNRSEFLNSLIGLPYMENAKGPDAYDCYHLAKLIQRTLWNRSLPEIDTPNCPTYVSIIDHMRAQLSAWSYVRPPEGLNVLVNVPDGSIVILAGPTQSPHIGTWLDPEHVVIHTFNTAGVIAEDLATLRMSGWQRQRFYAPPQ